MKKMMLLFMLMCAVVAVHGQSVFRIGGMELAPSGFGLLETQPHRQIDSLAGNYADYYARLALWINARDSNGDSQFYSSEFYGKEWNSPFIPTTPVKDTVNFLGLDNSLFVKSGTFRTADNQFKITQFHQAFTDKATGLLVFTIQNIGSSSEPVKISAGLHVDFDVPNAENVATSDDDKVIISSSGMSFIDAGSKTGMKISSLTEPVIVNIWPRKELGASIEPVRTIMSYSSVNEYNNAADYHGYIGCPVMELQKGETMVLGFELKPYTHSLSKTGLEQTKRRKEKLTLFVQSHNYKSGQKSTTKFNSELSFNLQQNYPNPFNPSTEIQFSIVQNGTVHLDIYNMLGQRVRSLLSKHLTAGSYTFTWDGKDETGKNVASGIYIYRLSSHSQSTQKKMLLIR